MAHRILIVGGGSAGTRVANRLSLLYEDAAEIVVVDRDDEHVHRAGLALLPFGLTSSDDLVRSRRAYLRDPVHLRIAEVVEIDLATGEAMLAGGETLGYDVLVVATGACSRPQATPGLADAGAGERVFTLATIADATRLRDALERLRYSRLVVAVAEPRVQWPVAALELAFLADWQLRTSDVRERTNVTFAVPMDAPVAKPTAAARLNGLLAAKEIALETRFLPAGVDDDAGVLVAADGRRLEYDLLVTLPAQGGSPFLARTPGLVDDLGFVHVDRATLQSRVASNVFAIGDAAHLPPSGAGTASHVEADAVVGNVVHLLEGGELENSFETHSGCFVATGFRKALLLDVTSGAEPLPGRFPEQHIGPLPVLRESRLHHRARLAAARLYWHYLLPGRDVPDIPEQLRLAAAELGLADGVTAAQPVA